MSRLFFLAPRSSRSKTTIDQFSEKLDTLEADRFFFSSRRHKIKKKTKTQIIFFLSIKT
jgi:hypothetical protein